MKKIIFYIFLFLFLGVFLYSGYRLLDKMLVYKQIDDTYDNIAELVVQTVPTTAKVEADQEQGTTAPAEQSEHDDLQQDEEDSTEPAIPGLDVTVPIMVDFETLCEINPDVVGWLYCEGTSINYPVLKGESNDTYLYHQYDGSYSEGGSIFMDYRCAGDFSDDYTVIYGHNMLADSMFNCLDYFREQEYLEEHSRFFYLSSDGKNYCLDVICTNLTAYRDDLRLFELRDDERNLELIRSRAEVDSGIDVSNEDQMVLLATCTYDFKNARCTLLCKVTPIR